MLPVSKRTLTSLFDSYARREDGSLIIFSLFMFIVMILFTGLAVDLMRFETKRALLQSTIDRATLAAASLDQTLDPQDVVDEYFRKAGLGDNVLQVEVAESYVGEDENGEGGELVGRTVSIETKLEMPTFIMHMMGTPVLKTPTGGAAEERIQNVEISLVLDVSGSMGNNNRLTNLKSAAREFIDTVIDEERTEGITSMSIIPYNGYVVVPDEMLDRLNAGPTTRIVAEPNDYDGDLDGALVSYPVGHTVSNCVRFRREGPLDTDRNDYLDTAITLTQPLERVAHFDEGGSSGYWFDEAVPVGKAWCPEDGTSKATRNEIMPLSADIDDLKAKINALRHGGWTGIDNGVKWGAALLDPAFRPLIEDMITGGDVETKMENRPNDYDPTETIKVMVVMTDGDNTLQRDLKDDFKHGPSRVWYSKDKADDGRWYDGFFVEMPDNSTNYRWYQPRSPSSNSDHRWYATDELPSDIEQLDYQYLYSRFSEDDLASYFFRYRDNTAYNAHRRAVYNYSSYDDTDTRLDEICEAARAQRGLVIYTIAFEAPDKGKSAMRRCAGLDAYYYEVEPNSQFSIQDAFRSIAGQITQLRLTQ